MGNLKKVSTGLDDRAVEIFVFVAERRASAPMITVTHNDLTWIRQSEF